MTQQIISGIASIAIALQSLLAGIPAYQAAQVVSSDFDFKVDIDGGTSVVQGNNLHLSIRAKLISGQPFGDLVSVDLLDEPTGVTFSVPDVHPSWGNKIYGIDKSLEFTRLKIHVPYSIAPGIYNIKIELKTPSGIARTYPLSLKVLSTNEINIPKQPFPTAVPIPMKTEWENNMTTEGKRFCDKNLIDSQGTYTGSVWFYDGERVFYQIADYTKDPSWNTCAKWVQNVYQP